MRIFGLMAGLWCGLALGQAVVAVPALPGAGVVQARGAEKKPSDPQAARLVYQAALLLRRGDKENAQKQLDSARALNDQELRLWSTYAALAAARGDKAAAIEDDRKELALHPDATEVYAALADLQDGLGRRADEEGTLRAGIAAEPRTPSAAARLVRMLVEDGKAAEAVSLGMDSVVRFTAVAAAEPRLNPRAVDGLEFELANAQRAAGMTAESLATTVALLKVTTNASYLNDGAYRLAEANVELALAEKSGRAALEQAESGSRRMTLDTAPEVIRAVMGQVTAMWDTVGWTLFREGKLEDAESYVRAAWLRRQSVGVGEHLAEIEAARGDKNKALMVCEVTLAGVKVDATPGETKLSAEMQVAADASAAEAAKTAAADLAKLQQIADGLRKAGASAKGQTGLKEALTIAMAPMRGVSGSGEFALLLGYGIVESATSTSKTNTVGMLSAMQAARVGMGLWPAGSGARLVMKAQVKCAASGCVAVMGSF